MILILGGFLVNNTNDALNAEKKFKTSVEEAQDYIENFDILETINNVGNDEIFTPVKVCRQILNILPNEVWSNPEYKWLNPCDKNGVFLREIALRLDDGLKIWEPDEEKRRKHILQNMLFSLGLTRFTSQVSRRTVYYCAQANKQFDGKSDTEGHSINGYAIGNGEWFDTDEGNILTPKTEHTFNKQGKCTFCGTAEKDKSGKPGRYSDPKQLEHYAYEFIHVADINSHLQKRFFGGKQMKFDIIIGNPPYQLSDGGGEGASATPLYHLFIQQAKRLNPKYLSMIIPARWYSGGKGLDGFRSEMLSDNHISELHDFPETSMCFPNLNIRGGVCYFLWNKNSVGNVKIVNYTKNHQPKIMERPLLEGKADTFIRYNDAISIIHKVMAFNEKTMDSKVQSRNPFGIPSNFCDFSVLPNEKSSIKLYRSRRGSLDDKQVYISANQIKTNLDYKDKIKVLVSKASPGGDEYPHAILGAPFLSEQNSVSTETFLIIDFFDNEIEANNLISYMQTRFFRFLVSLIKNTQNISRNCFSFVPIQNFKESWTDKKLFKKYGISEKEALFINTLIRPFDSNIEEGVVENED